MQTWAKRGIQSAFVTGGLLMLGTGIASADENVNPDAAPSAVDGGVAVPVDVEQNVVGNPIDQHQLPEAHHEISGDRVSADVVTGSHSPANPLVREAQQRYRESGRLTRGNAASVAAAAPVQPTGNTLAVGAGADTGTSARQEAVPGGDVQTPDEEGTLSGNIFSGQWAAPVQVTGDGVAVDSAAVVDDSDAASGDQGHVDGVERWIDTNRTAVGDVPQPRFADPVALDDDGAAVTGDVSALGSTADSGTAGVLDDIENGDIENGDIENGDLPIPLPASLVGTALWAVSDTAAEHGDDVTSHVGGAPGSDERGTLTSDVPTTAFTRAGGDALGDGEGSIAGNVLSESAARLLDKAAGAGGNVHGRAHDGLDPVAGGDVETSGHRGSAVGNAVAGELSTPVQAFGDSAGVAARNDATALNESYLASGGDGDTSAADAVASGNLAVVPVNTAARVFSVPVAVIALADAYTDNHTVGEADATADARDSRTAAEKPATVYGVPADVLGTATAFGRDTVVQRTGDEYSARTVPSPDHGIQLPDSIDRLMTATELPSLEALDRMPSLGALPVLELSSLTGMLPLDAPQERSRSTRVSAPGVSGDVSTISGVLPLDEERSTSAATPGLRTLPVAAPVLPVVVPIAPVAQPRSVDATTLPALPALPPVQDLLPALPALPLLPGAASERTIDAPALPGLTEVLPTALVQDLLPALPALPTLPGAASERGINPPALPGLTELLPVPQVPALPALPLLPGAASQRSLDVPALPSLPALPGERSVDGPALPGLPGLTGTTNVEPSVSGLKTNPAERLTNSRERSFAPALSTLDTDSMLDTVQLPRI
jgi:hypothetical protein